MRRSTSSARIGPNTLHLSLSLPLAVFALCAFVASARAADEREMLRKKVEAAPVRVVVRLRTTVQSETALLPGREVDAGRRVIASAQQALQAELPTVGCRMTAGFRTIPFAAFEADAAGLAALEESPMVAELWEDRIATPSLYESAGIVQADQSWSAGFDGSGKVVAIVDSGVDGTHPFLAGKIVSEACYSVTGDCPNGTTEQDGLGAGAPCAFAASQCRHGTHVAGIAAGRGPDFSGIARGADIVAIAASARQDLGCDPKREDLPCMRFFHQDLIKALEHVLDLQSRFDIVAVNLSLGSGVFSEPCDDYDPAMAAVFANLHSHGIAVVASAGNDGEGRGISHPACDSAVVSVGAVDKAGQPALFSNFAPFLSLVAPGVSIFSSVPAGAFSSFDGTSMAAPHVTGAWAILRQQEPSATVDRVLAALRATGIKARTPDDFTVPSIRVRQALRELAGEKCGTWTDIGSVRLPPTFFEAPGRAAAGRDVQVAPELFRRILLSKSFRDARWVISQNGDGTVTGNVFRAPHTPPQFVFCTPDTNDGLLRCFGATACTDGAKGTVETPDGRWILANKDINGRRWAIARVSSVHTLTGTVFEPGAGHARFVYCVPGLESTYRCFVADPCTSGFCGLRRFREQWRFASDVTLPCTFFGVDECVGLSPTTPIAPASLP